MVGRGGGDRGARVVFPFSLLRLGPELVLIDFTFGVYVTINRKELPTALRLWVEIIVGAALRADNLEFQKYTARERVNYLAKNLRKWIRCPISVLMQANPKAAGHFPTVLCQKRGQSTI